MSTQDPVSSQPAYDLVLLILGAHSPEALHRSLRKEGIEGITIIPGKGTRKNAILEFLCLNDVSREIILLVSLRDRTPDLLATLRKDFKLEQPGKGIAVSFPLAYVLGVSEEDEPTPEPQVLSIDSYAYLALLTIVDRGKGAELLRIADDHGQQGATILEGQGTADRRHTFFNFPIIREKDVVLMIGMRDKILALAKDIHDRMDLEEANSGVQFTLPVERTLGLYGNQDAPDPVQAEEKSHDLAPGSYYALQLITTPELAHEGVDILQAAHSKGATVIPGRGADPSEVATVFNVPIEPRRDLVFSVLKAQESQTIARNLNRNLELARPHHGYLYALPLINATGIQDG